MTDLFVRGYIHGLIQLECELALGTNAPIQCQIGVIILYYKLMLFIDEAISIN